MSEQPDKWDWSRDVRKMLHHAVAGVVTNDYYDHFAARRMPKDPNETSYDFWGPPKEDDPESTRTEGDEMSEVPLEQLGLDEGIKEYVRVLREAGIETYESCEGGKGHAYPEPTVAFHGEYPEGFRALSVAIASQLPVFELRRVWTMQDGEPVGPSWHMVFAGPYPENKADRWTT